MNAAAFLVGNALLVAVTGVFWAFTAIYFAQGRWYRHPVGRGLFSFGLACSLMLTLGVVRLIIGDFALYPYLRAALYFAVLIVICLATWLLLRRPSHKE